MIAVTARIPPARRRRAGLRASSPAGRCWRQRSGSSPAGIGWSSTPSPPGPASPVTSPMTSRAGRRCGCAWLPASWGTGRASATCVHRHALLVRELSGSCAGIAELRDAGSTADGNFFLALEPIEGETVGTLVKGGVPVSLDGALRLAIRIGEVVGGCAQHGTDRRAARPGPSPRARVRRGHQASWTSVSTGRSVPSRAREQLAWLAPEIASGGPCSERADVYGIGAMLYLLLTGHPPTRAEARSGAGPVREAGATSFLPGSCGRGYPGSVQAILFRALDHDPARRHEDVSVLLNDLSESLRLIAPVNSGDRPGAGRWRVAAGVVGTAAALAALWLSQSRAPTRRGGAPSVTGTHNRDAGEPTRERRRRRQRWSFLRRPRPPGRPRSYATRGSAGAATRAGAGTPAGPSGGGSASPADCFACSGGKPRSAPFRHAAAARPGETGGRKPRARRRTFGAPAARRAVGAAHAQADSPPGRRRSWPSGSRQHSSSFFPSRIASRDPFPARGPGPRRRRRFQRHHRLALARSAIAHRRPRPGPGGHDRSRVMISTGGSPS